MTIKNHKHYQLCYRAHLGTSFSPEKRAEMYCSTFDQDMASLNELGAEQKVIDKAEALFIGWMHAKSRCISTMITGPANFPVTRAEKASKSEEKKGKAYYDYVIKVSAALEKEQFYSENPDARPIDRTDSDALERLAQKLDLMERLQDIMKAANKIHRKEGQQAASDYLDSTGLRDQLRHPEDNYFEPFALTNHNAKIKRVRGQIAELERIKEQDTSEKQIGESVKYVKDTGNMRIYFKFDGKPDVRTRDVLKSNGFRWTPSKGHWGRKLTNNAELSAIQVQSYLKKEDDEI